SSAARAPKLFEILLTASRFILKRTQIANRPLKTQPRLELKLSPRIHAGDAGGWRAQQRSWCGVGAAGPVAAVNVRWVEDIEPLRAHAHSQSFAELELAFDERRESVGGRAASGVTSEGRAVEERAIRVGAIPVDILADGDVVWDARSQRCYTADCEGQREIVPAADDRAMRLVEEAVAFLEAAQLIDVVGAAARRVGFNGVDRVRIRVAHQQREMPAEPLVEIQLQGVVIARALVDDGIDLPV